jgi:oligopeptidase B
MRNQRIKYSNLIPPKAKKHPQKFLDHGVERIDNYFWLRNRESQEVIDYLQAENEYAEKSMEPLKPLQDKLFEEIKNRIPQHDESAPYPFNGYSYYTRFEEGREYPLYCRKLLEANEAEEVLLDVNVLAESYAYYNVSGLSISLDNEKLAFGEDTVSRRIYNIRFKDLKTGLFLDDFLEGTSGSIAWASDNKTVFYTKIDPDTLRSYQVYKHILGTPQSEDVKVFEETDDAFYCYCYRSKSKKFIFIVSNSTLTTEVQILDADHPDKSFKVVQERIRGLEYSVDHFGDHLYILHNDDKAENFKISKTPVHASSKENWETIVEHRPDVLLEDVELFEDFMVVSERKKGLIYIRIMPWQGEEHYLSFKDPAYDAYLSTNAEFDTHILRFAYTSLTTPQSVYDYNMDSRERTLIKQQEVLGDFDSKNYTSERIMAVADDGVQIPISLVYRRGTLRQGSTPLLLYGYGSYGVSVDPGFSSARLSLLDRGFIFAIAHIRGGQVMGRSWYEDGKLLTKKNTFNDFIRCGEHLIDHKYTSYKHLYAMGGSAGGLLMGVIANMRPDMWNGIVAQVPFVDVINTMLDASIPLTTGEYDEWGNPEDPHYFHYILSYSPYDNVKAQDYPAMLITTGLHDSQVQYWEPAKWVAKLRDLKTNDEPLFLVTNMDAGHGGASGRFKRFKEVAMEYAFLLGREEIDS